MEIWSRRAALLAGLLGLGLVSTGAEAKITRVVEKTFAVQPGGQFVAETQGGNITLKTDDGNEVRIVATQVIDANTEEAATRVLDKLKLTLEQQGTTVRAVSQYEKQGGMHWGNWPPVQVSYTVTVPRKFNLDLNTSGGNISVASVVGTVRARTSGGDLSFDRIDGDLDGKTSGGNVSLKEGTARANLSTSGGNIAVERAGGPTSVSTSGGNLKIMEATKLLSASTSGGNIEAHLTEPLTDDASLSTSGGDVSVQVIASAAFVLDAQTSGGEVRVSNLTLSDVKTNSSKSELRATVNAGGPKLKLRTSGGDIRVKGL